MQPLTEQALAGCEDEPIRVPGAVQPHGVLLACREDDLAVVVASANAAEVLGARPATLAGLLAGTDLQALHASLAGELEPLSVVVGGQPFDVALHRADGLLVTEWEPRAGAAEAGQVWHRRLPAVLQRLSAAQDLAELTVLLARDVRALTGFDRVMVYRFDRDWNGEVVAEDRREDLEPFLGLHYPAGDIPAQARALYESSWMRLIPDTRYVPVPLDPAHLQGRPLDLSGAMLRSVSPVHLEYLANMGVAASMSVSLLDRGRLWGLVACHHLSPRRPSYVDRTAAEFLGRTASLLLRTAVDAGSREQVVAVAQRSAALVAAVARSPRSPLTALTDGEVTALDLVPAAGAAVRLDGRLVLLGATPPAERVDALVPALLRDGTTAVHDLGTRHPDLAADASGVLAVPVGDARDFLAWFRPEALREVTWAGDPHTSKVVVEDGTPRLSPRRSFAAWSETVRGTSAPWQEHEVDAARRLAAHLVDAALSRRRDDDRLGAALQRTLLLERLPQVPGVALAARYRPSEDDVVGGDWYDLVLLPGGRVTVVLGDAAGHGLGAAAVTAQLRHALRAHLLRDLGPAGALEALNGLVAALLPGELATAVVVELDPATGEALLASAGHLPAVRRSADGAELVREGRGPGLGLVDAASYRQARVVLGPGERLLLYSDGLVERRGTDLQDGLDRLCGVAAGGDPDPEALLDRVLDALRPGTSDDVTLLALGPS